MAVKNNIRSIRFSDELAELIDRQQGNTFTEKFENLITRCTWELPAKEQELAKLEKRIQEKQELLKEMTVQAGELRMTINNLLPKVRVLETSINQAVGKWDV